jgi:hypothetical protein
MKISAYSGRGGREASRGAGAAGGAGVEGGRPQGRAGEATAGENIGGRHIGRADIVDGKTGAGAPRGFRVGGRNRGGLRRGDVGDRDLDLERRIASDNLGEDGELGTEKHTRSGEEAE